jgi:hypothetical protein
MNASRSAITCVVLIAAAAAGCGSSATTSSAHSHPDPATQPASVVTRGDDDEPATRSVLGLPAGWVLASKATYAASQTPGEVIIRATGENPTGGYEVKLYQSPLRIWPPQYMLAHKKPDGIVTQAFTPFEVTASFKAGEPIKQVVVSDASGKHTVTVDQARD